MKPHIFLLLCVVVSIAPTRGLNAGVARQPVTIDDLVGRVQIPVVSLAPNGRQVACLTLRGMPREDLYEISVGLVATSGKSDLQVLGRYQLAPENVFETNSGRIRATAGQLIWAPNSRELAYTVHVGVIMELRIWNTRVKSERVVLRGFDQIEMKSQDGGRLEVMTSRSVSLDTKHSVRPRDRALLVRDEDRFYMPLGHPNGRTKVLSERWEYAWGGHSAEKIRRTDENQVASHEPAIVGPLAAGMLERSSRPSQTALPGQVRSPNETLVAAVEDSMSDAEGSLQSHRVSQIIIRDLSGNEAEPRVLVSSARPRAMQTILGWSADSKELYYVSVGPQSSSLNAVNLDGYVRQIFTQEAEFSFPDPTSELSASGRIAVFVRSSNIVPDELVSLDVKTGISITLLSPNRHFQDRALPVVRFMWVACCTDVFYGRLYLPVNYEKGKKYPLVFTNYISTPGFYASVGDEVPILALAANGIAVFAMNSSEANRLSTTGDFRFEISRVEEPTHAMEWVYHTLVDEGLVDPERCGLTGLSYGSEIAMYAYWASRVFRAISVASASWEPMNYILAGPSYSKDLDSRGFEIPEDGAFVKWRELSAGLNARANLPPLLIQSPDEEEYFGNVETWLRLRRAGAPVEWYEYPNEGHVKRSPADRWCVYQRNLEWFRFWLKEEESRDPAKAKQYVRWHQMRNKQGSRN